MSGLSGCLDVLVLHPTRNRAEATGSVPRFIRTPDAVAEVWVAKSHGASHQPPDAFVLKFCGVTGRAQTDALYGARQWGDRAVEVWAISYPGQDGSSGPPRVGRIPDAALAVYDALCHEAGGRPIFVSGDSFGTMVALHVAARRPVAGVVLRDPLPLRQLLLQRWGWPNLWLIAAPLAWQIPRDLDTHANAQRAQAPAVFLLSQEDSVVPPRFQDEVVAAYAGPKCQVHIDGDHSAPIRGIAVLDVQVALDWLWLSQFPARAKAVHDQTVKTTALASPDFAKAQPDP